MHRDVCVRICRRDLKNLVYFAINSSRAESSEQAKTYTYVHAARCDLCLVPVLKVEVEMRCNGARFLCNGPFSIYGFLRHETLAAILQVVHTYSIDIESEGKDRTTEIGHGWLPEFSRANTSSQTAKFIVKCIRFEVDKVIMTSNDVFTDTSLSIIECIVNTSENFSIDRIFPHWRTFRKWYLYHVSGNSVVWEIIVWKI